MKKMLLTLMLYGASFTGVSEAGVKVKKNFSSSSERDPQEVYVEGQGKCYPYFEQDKGIDGFNFLWEKDFKVKRLDDSDFERVPEPVYMGESEVKRIIDSLYKVVDMPEILSPDFYMAVIKNESSLNKYAVSPAGARGLAQIMEGTWREINPLSNFYLDAFDPVMNLKTGMIAYKNVYEYVKERNPFWDSLTEENKVRQVIAGYNWGIGNLRKVAGWDLARVPSETKNYFTRVEEFVD